MSLEQVTIDIGGGRSISIETGKLALLANGSVVVKQGGTTVLVCACAAAPREGIDFFPLSVEYRIPELLLGDFLGTALDHDCLALDAGVDQVDVAAGDFVIGRVCDELARRRSLPRR